MLFVFSFLVSLLRTCLGMHDALEHFETYYLEYRKSYCPNRIYGKKK